jgi:hypothetical protein
VLENGNNVVDHLMYGSCTEAVWKLYGSCPVLKGKWSRSMSPSEWDSDRTREVYLSCSGEAHVLSTGWPLILGDGSEWSDLERMTRLTCMT